MKLFRCMLVHVLALALIYAPALAPAIAQVTPGTSPLPVAMGGNGYITPEQAPFNAAGDCVTDDQAAITAAIAAAVAAKKRLLFSQACYAHAGTLAFGFDNLEVVFAGFVTLKTLATYNGIGVSIDAGPLTSNFLHEVQFGRGNAPYITGHAASTGNLFIRGVVQSYIEARGGDAATTATNIEVDFAVGTTFRLIVDGNTGALPLITSKASTAILLTHRNNGEAISGCQIYVIADSMVNGVVVAGVSISTIKGFSENNSTNDFFWQNNGTDINTNNVVTDFDIEGIGSLNGLTLGSNSSIGNTFIGLSLGKNLSIAAGSNRNVFYGGVMNFGFTDNGTNSTFANTSIVNFVPSATVNNYRVQNGSGVYFPDRTNGNVLPQTVASPLTLSAVGLLACPSCVLISGTAHGDSAYNIASTDRYVYTNAAFTTARIWTLPAANSVAAGTTIWVQDAQGTVTAANTLTVARAGADTIDISSTSFIISNPGGGITFTSDGVSNWGLPIQTTSTGGTGRTSPTLHGLLIGEATAPVNGLTCANGQLVVGSTGLDPVCPTMGKDGTIDNAGNLTVTKTNNVAFTAVATAAPGQLPGEPSTGSATAGNVGEYVETVVVTGSAVACTPSGTAVNVATLAIPSGGDWDVEINAAFNIAATTNLTQTFISASLVSATVDATPGRFYIQNYAPTVFGAVTQSSDLTRYRFSVSGATSVFFVARATFTVSTVSAYGLIRARRVR